jgi:hypothetical protein
VTNIEGGRAALHSHTAKAVTLPQMTAVKWMRSTRALLLLFALVGVATTVVEAISSKVSAQSAGASQPVPPKNPAPAPGGQEPPKPTKNTASVPSAPQAQTDANGPTAIPADNNGKPQSVKDYFTAVRWSSRPIAWGAILAGVIIISGVVLLYRTTVDGAEPLILRLTPSFFFWLGMTYCCLLLLLAVVYSLTKDPTAGATVIGGIVPIAVPWFGALGAVTISLEGVFLWNSQWDRSFNYWHIGRPIFGAVLGTVAFFIFVAIGSAAGSAPRFLESQNTKAKDYIVFYIVAFLVGYREETFRELIKRATDLILKPGTPPPSAPAVSFRVGGSTVSEIQCPVTAVGAAIQVTVDVRNSGTAPLMHPVVTIAPVAPTPPGTFAVVNDLVTGGGDLAAGQGRSLDITFSPLAAGPFAATLSVAGTNLTPPKTIRVSGR